MILRHSGLCLESAGTIDRRELVAQRVVCHRPPPNVSLLVNEPVFIHFFCLFLYFLISANDGQTFQLDLQRKDFKSLKN